MSTPAICSASRTMPSGQRRGVSGGGAITKADIKVCGDRMVYVQTDDGVAWEPIDLTHTALGELLLEAMPPLPAARKAGEKLKAWVGRDLGPEED